MDLALSLMDPDTGVVIKLKDDYGTHPGGCGKPITKSDITRNIPACHSKIRSFEFIVELLAQHLSHEKWWTPTNGVKYSKEEKKSYQTARDSLKIKLWDKLAINIGDPGDMVTGSAFQTFACDTSRAFLTSLVRKDIQEEFSVMLLGLCATVKVINSQKHKVDVERLQ